MTNERLKQIPKMDALLNHPSLAESLRVYGRTAVLAAAREVLDEVRQALSDPLTPVPAMEALAGSVAQCLRLAGVPSLRRVINATGVLLHTNLGRAPLTQEAAAMAEEAACGYTTLEYNVSDGNRGSRHAHVSQLLCELTGAQDAMVVNNNAAAVLLMLSALTRDREVIVSRGELIEIGGSFRIPDMMALSGAVLLEVGTTNRTRAADYAAAVTEKTGALMMAHTSNFKIVGFTQKASLEELVALGRERGVPVFYDVGSGSLLPLPGYLPDEPRIAECIKKGADVVCFSGDKLLGGPQAGILLGGAEYIACMKTHPLARVLRVDKMTLAALEATLRLYRDPPRAVENIPILRMLTASVEALYQKAERLVNLLNFLIPEPLVLNDSGQVGGGAAPGEALPSVTVALSPARGVRWLEEALRQNDPPIIARIAQDRLLLDMRTLEETDFPQIIACLRRLEKAAS